MLSAPRYERQMSCSDRRTVRSPGQRDLRAWLPGLRQPLLQDRPRALERDALLLERVPVAQGDRAVLERLVVDRQRPRGADLVLAAVALADRGRVVVLGRHHAAHVLVQAARLLHE